MNAPRNKGLWLATAALALLVASAAPLHAQEGFDPLRQITSQVVKANLLLTLDTTGSQAFPTDYNCPLVSNSFHCLLYDEDSTGHLFWNGDGGCTRCGYYTLKGNTYGSVTVPNYTQSNSKPATSDCSSGSNCRYWYYVLVFEPPSRMAVWKNALGNSVSVIDPITGYTPPTPSYPTSWTGLGKTILTPQTVTGAPFAAWVYTLDCGTGKCSSPGTPFTPMDTSNSYKPKLTGNSCSVGTCTQILPKDVVGTTVVQVNWAAVEFSADLSSSCSGSSSFRLVDFDTTGANKDLATLETYLNLKTSGGLNAIGGTNTISALTWAKKLRSTASGTDGGPIDAAVGWKNTLSKDATCKRPYGVILVTDGLSNQCNPSDGDWISLCGSGPSACDSSGSAGSDCPNKWGSFAASTANGLWNMYAGTVNSAIKPRTFTIGVSQFVGPCELDYIAFMGRTDANSPNGDTGISGYDATKNPYLPINDTASSEGSGSSGTPSSASSTYDGPTGQYKFFKGIPTTTAYSLPSARSHGHNAFFATDPTSLSNSLIQIINASASGDYTTSAPVSGSTSSAGSFAYVASTKFPSWEGHLVEFDVTKPIYDASTPPKIIDYTRIWDAGTVLKNMSSANRKIYTWDSSLALVELKADLTNLGTIQTISGIGTAFTSNILDFVRGNDGTGTSTPRTWRLGPLINSTPAIVGPPIDWTQGRAYTHDGFKTTYANRTQVLWVGSDDGMIHLFRANDRLAADGKTVLDPGGEEVFAIIPPSLLAKQLTLYTEYNREKAASSSGVPTSQVGQPPSFKTHTYGVANSFRFGDIYSSTWGGYKTVGLMAMGPGVTQNSDGTFPANQVELVAVDITHPCPEDPNYSASAPFSILWAKKSLDTGMAGMGVPWSVPAMSPVDASISPSSPGATKWRLMVPDGYDSRNTGGSTGSQKTGTGFQTPHVYILDPVDGSLISTLSITPPLNTPVPYVGNQAFADPVLLDKMAKGYQGDNLADTGLQADMNGRIWFIASSSGVSFDSIKIGIDATTYAAQPQPIYYPPAASGIGDPTKGTSSTAPGCIAFAFQSGTLWEKSINVTGPNVGTTGNFFPSLYLATAKKAYPYNDAAKLFASLNAVATNAIFQKKISALLRPTDGSDPNYVAGKPATYNLSPTSQVTGAPFILVPKTGLGTYTALFLVYDPAVGCNGYSYVIQIDSQPNTDCSINASSTVVNVYAAGAGAASGFTIAGTAVLVAKSGIGTGASATLMQPKVPPAAIGGAGTSRPVWWKQLK
jgi:hypothetical protein